MICARINDSTDRLVTRNERITHSRKAGHLARPQQLFGAGADPAIMNFHKDIAVHGGFQRSFPHFQSARGIKYDGGTIQSVLVSPLGLLSCFRRMETLQGCQTIGTLLNVKLFGQSKCHFFATSALVMMGRAVGTAFIERKPAFLSIDVISANDRGRPDPIAQR